MSETDPFGAWAPSPAHARIRHIAKWLPYNYVGRKLASALLGPAGGRAARPFDVQVFGSQKARLYPYDNICEKRVYLTPHHWDPAERQFMMQIIRESDDRSFIYIDVGANVGLYSLFARSIALIERRGFKALCIEADPEMRARMGFNVAASGAAESIKIVPYAAADDNGMIAFNIDQESRGMSRISTEGKTSVPARTLLSILEEAVISKIDMLKLDIEGYESPVLKAFFGHAPTQLLPTFIQVETSHNDDTARLIESAGYTERFRNQLNAIFERDASNARTGSTF